LPLLAVAFAFFALSCDVLVGIVHLRFLPPSSHALHQVLSVPAPKWSPYVVEYLDRDDRELVVIISALLKAARILVIAKCT
jgi:hypothetical protein